MLHKLAAGIFDEAPLDSGPPELEQVFKAEGLLAAHNPQYIRREPQLQLARAVHRALTEHRHLMVEAPCGVGKSLGYAVPAILTKPLRKTTVVDAQGRSKQTYKPIIIVTANIALQEQLVNKDLPFLQRALTVPFTFGLLKGRQNYVCRTMAEYGNVSAERDTDEDKLAVERLTSWALSTTTGDKSELNFEPPPHLWRRFSITNDECPGSLCPLFNECHGYRAQERALGADVIVTNYHTLFADIFLRITTGGSILPDDCPVIMDEAHEAADIARDVMGGALSTGSTLAAFAACAKAKLCARGQHDKEVYALFSTLTEHIQHGNYKNRLRQNKFTNAAHLGERLLGYADRASREIEMNASAYTKVERTTLLSAIKRATNTARLLQLVDELPEAYVISLEQPQDRTGYVTAEIKVVEPAKILQKTLYLRPSVIGTSATLTAQGSFELVRTELGAPRDLTDYAELPSPFDFQRQSLLIIPKNIPENPNSDEFRTAMADALCETVRNARGRTLGLFTSYRNLRIAGDALRAAGCPYRVLQQGDAPRMLLASEFRDDVTSVLLGTTSFWTGIDIQGEALSCVFIDKLPFPEMGNPVLDALGDRYDDVFSRFSLPRTIMMFRQGIGRLIRSVHDRGVMVVLDQRLRTKNYGHGFIRSLPAMPHADSLDAIRTFFEHEHGATWTPAAVQARAKAVEQEQAFPF